MEYLIHPLLDEGRIREPQSRSVLRACKFARQPEESGAQFAQGQALPFFRETCPLKSRDQVVGQPNYFQIEGVGRESTSGNLPERIVLTQLSDARSEEHTSELQSQFHLVCRLLLEKKKHRRVYR